MLRWLDFGREWKCAGRGDGGKIWKVLVLTVFWIYEYRVFGACRCVRYEDVELLINGFFFKKCFGLDKCDLVIMWYILFLRLFLIVVLCGREVNGSSSNYK